MGYGRPYLRWVVWVGACVSGTSGYAGRTGGGRFRIFNLRFSIVQGDPQQSAKQTADKCCGLRGVHQFCEGFKEGVLLDGEIEGNRGMDGCKTGAVVL
jgi:hypothetical protein